MEGGKLVKKTLLTGFSWETSGMETNCHMMGDTKEPLPAAGLTHCLQCSYGGRALLGLKDGHCSDPECRKWCGSEIQK